MKLVIAALILLYAVLGAVTMNHPVPGKGNDSTYSGNGNGDYAGKMVQACADLAVEEFRKDPSINADGLFKYCVHKQGVRSI